MRLENKQYHAVYDNKGKALKTADPKPSKAVAKKKQAARLSYPFHLLKTNRDYFIVKDSTTERSLRTQASKQSLLLLGHKIRVSRVDGGLLVRKIAVKAGD